jgi:uncharacterized protein (DUF433 family)
VGEKDDLSVLIGSGRRVTATSTALLDGGIYSVPEAAGLVGAGQQAMRVWIEGRPGRQSPLIDNQIGRLGRKVAVSFTNLMELRFVAFFVRVGVGLREIRSIMEEAKRTLQHPHPFATKTVFKTDGRKIVAEIARRNGIKAIYDLKTTNYEMELVVMASLKNAVVYDPTGNAILWKPRPKSAPNIVVHPSYAFGRPILRGSGVPTEALFQAMQAEGDFKIVAELYEVPERQVLEAISFEKDLRRAA